MSLRIGRQRWKASEETKILTRQQVAPREGNQVEGAHPKRGGGHDRQVHRAGNCLLCFGVFKGSVVASALVIQALLLLTTVESSCCVVTLPLPSAHSV